MQQRRFLFCAYREWGIGAIEKATSSLPENSLVYIAKNRKQFSDFAKHFPSFDLVFFVGWSWLVPEKFLNKNTCICFHPSKLPKYRGGSPIQNQIIRGEIQSAVTAFKMDSGVDTGPIYCSEDISLVGNLDKVLENILEASAVLLSQILKDYLEDGAVVFYPQDESKSSYYERRSPEQSEISLDDFQNCTSVEIYNKIRSLQDPYPNAYIVCGDGKKLFITHAKLEG